MFSGSNGCLLATMSAEEVTARRTAATSALASKLLAPRDATCLALLGAGQQAESHIESHLVLLTAIKNVHVWSRTRRSAEHLVQKLSKKVRRNRFFNRERKCECLRKMKKTQSFFGDQKSEAAVNAQSVPMDDQEGSL